MSDDVSDRWYIEYQNPWQTLWYSLPHRSGTLSEKESRALIGWLQQNNWGWSLVRFRLTNQCTCEQIFIGSVEAGGGSADREGSGWHIYWEQPISGRWCALPGDHGVPTEYCCRAIVRWFWLRDRTWDTVRFKFVSPEGEEVIVSDLDV